MKILTTILLSTISHIAFSQQRYVKKEIERLVYIDKKIEKRFNNIVQNVTIFNPNGQETEYITYGQSFGKSVVNKDSSITRYCGKDYKKIDAIDFMTYDEKNRKIKEETWFYVDNQKSLTTGYAILTYNDSNLESKEISYSKTGNIRSIRTFLYDLNQNNIEVVDTIFISSDSNKISINRKVNQFDTLNRVSSTIEFIDGKILLKKKFLYNSAYGLKTELRYDNDSDTSLWSITETIVDYIDQFPYPKKTKENYWKVINSKTESREKYIYNKDCLLDRIEFYSGCELTSYLKYEYEFY
jgi:hypothetical protein